MNAPVTDMSKLDTLISDLSQINGITGPIFSSIAWSYATRLVGMTITLHNMHDSPATPNPDQRQRILQMERRIEDSKLVLGWAMQYASAEYAPTGEIVIERMLENTPVPETDELLIKHIAELAGMSIDEARAAAKLNERELESRRALQRDAIANDRQNFINLIDQALEATSYQDYALSLQDSLTVLNKIAQKCESYEQRRRARMFSTRRLKILNDLGAECRLLTSIMNEADELADRFANQLEAMGPETVTPESVEATARAVN